jgi:L-rhamnose mutarotase
MRKAFRMSVHANSHDEYARRHQPIWAELKEALLAHGVKTYSIYLDPITSDLFAYAEIDSEERWKAIADTAVCRRWWQHMRELMPSNPDDSPVSRDLVEVFHVEGRDEGAC